MNKFYAALAALVAVAMAFPAAAEECYNTSAPEVDAGGYYVDNDACFPDTCTYSIWIYQESNDIPGLQRGDEVVDDTNGCIDSDTIIF
jgi:predicted nucleotide-binding protein (sugar kinase/HSP70/actin superfamily)